jgi:hypothetical protein
MLKTVVKHFIDEFHWLYNEVLTLVDLYDQDHSDEDTEIFYDMYPEYCTNNGSPDEDKEKHEDEYYDCIEEHLYATGRLVSVEDTPTDSQLPF